MDWAEQKQAGKAAPHAAVILNNILSLLGSKKSMVPYKPSVEMMVLTNGKVRSLFLLTLVPSDLCVDSPAVQVTLEFYGESRLEVGFLLKLNRSRCLLAR
jgi:hypothetical protein